MFCEFCDNEGTALVCDGGIAICDDCMAEAEFQAARSATEALDEAVAGLAVVHAPDEGGDGEFPW